MLEHFYMLVFTIGTLQLVTAILYIDIRDCDFCQSLQPIVETSVMSENDGITVRQTVAHTIQLWSHGLDTPRGSCLSRRKAQ